MTLQFRALKPLVPPAVEPVQIEEVRAHLKLETADEDALIAAHLRGARAFVENWLGRALIDQAWTLVLDAWGEAPVALPRGPVRAVTSVRVIGVDGAFAPVDPACYRLLSDPGLLCAAGPGLPPPAYAPGGIEIDYTAGFGPGWNDVPEDLRRAILLLTAQGVETRLPVATGALPAEVAGLLGSYRRVRL